MTAIITNCYFDAARTSAIASRDLRSSYRASIAPRTFFQREMCKRDAASRFRNAAQIEFPKMSFATMPASGRWSDRHRLFEKVENDTMTERYQSVNGAWPETVPPLTGPEAVTAAKRLYRLVMKKPFRGKIKVSSGNRHTWIRSGVMTVNPEGHHFGGWKDLVHGLSHYCHRRLHPGHKPHGGQGTHAFIERMMIEHVVNSGWLDGKLKRPDKPKPDLKETRHQKVLSKIEAWDERRVKAERAVKRAEKMLKRLQRSRARYELGIHA